MKGLACFGFAVLSVIGIAISAILNGWVLSVLWGWFITPLFLLPQLSIAHAIGLSLIMGMWTDKSRSQAKESETLTESLIKLSLQVFASPLLVLGLGWIVKQFIPLG